MILGRGYTSDRKGLIGFQNMMRQLWSVASNAIDQNENLTCEQFLTQHANELNTNQGYHPIKFAGISVGLNRTFVMTRA